MHDSIGDSINNGNLDQLLKAKFGDHCLVIYKDIESFTKLYTAYTVQQLGIGNEIVILLPYYQTVDQVRDSLKADGVNLLKSESACSLVVLDAYKAYFHSSIQLPAFAKSVAEFAARTGKGGISIFADMGVFGLFDNFHLLLQYESSLPRRFDIPVKGFCCYHVKDFESFEKESKKMLISKHTDNIQSSSVNCM